MPVLLRFPVAGFCNRHRFRPRKQSEWDPARRAAGPGAEVLKIADFGLARAFAVPIPKYTHEVVTVWCAARAQGAGCKGLKERRSSGHGLPALLESLGCVVMRRVLWNAGCGWCV